LHVDCLADRHFVTKVVTVSLIFVRRFGEGVCGCHEVAAGSVGDQIR
jgi:hypothetical protein